MEITVRKIRKDGFGVFRGLSPTAEDEPKAHERTIYHRCLAWIEYLAGSKAGEKIKSVLEAEGSEIFTCIATVTRS